MTALAGMQAVGTRLAAYVLAAMVGLAVLLIVAVAVNEFARPAREIETLQDLIGQSALQYRTSASVDTLKQVHELLDKLLVVRKASREFWQGMCQILLLNLLLPVLTSILGYVFGSMKRDA